MSVLLDADVVVVVVVVVVLFVILRVAVDGVLELADECVLLSIAILRPVLFPKLCEVRASSSQSKLIIGLTCELCFTSCTSLPWQLDAHQLQIIVRMRSFFKEQCKTKRWLHASSGTCALMVVETRRPPHYHRIPWPVTALDRRVEKSVPNHRSKRLSGQTIDTVWVILNLV